jgi:hypothetical protein
MLVGRLLFPRVTGKGKEEKDGQQLFHAFKDGH